MNQAIPLVLLVSAVSFVFEILNFSFTGRGGRGKLHNSESYQN